MTPILIDNRGLIKLGLISVLTTAIVFVAGFLGGYQQAVTFYSAGSKIETLVLPTQAALLDSDVEPQLPDTIVAGAEIDVDQPQVESKTSVKISAVESKTSNPLNKEKVNKTNEASASNKLAALGQTGEQTGKSSNKVNSDDKNIINNGDPLTIKKSSVKDKLASNDFQNESGESVATKEPDFMVLAALSSAELNSIKYSIQVGMYGRLTNAENMVRLLRAQQLDAYVSDYTNKKNESRYNVRFGYFIDKKSALSALKKYKNKQKGAGYLVKFSVKNMTRLADAKNIKQVITTEQTKKNSPPETMPSEAMSTETDQGDVSQADAASLSNVLAKALKQDLIDHTQAVTEPY